MPLQYYDPMLYASTSANPNVMSVTVTLTEPVEGELLREAVEQCRVRFPYFYIRPRVEGNELIPVPNPLPVIVRGTWAPTLLCSRETNYHLMAFKYEGNRLAVEMVHSICQPSRWGLFLSIICIAIQEFIIVRTSEQILFLSS